LAMVCITLLTDLQQRAPELAHLKQVLEERFADAHFIDMGHDRTLQELWDNAQLLKTYQYYPAGSVHISLILQQSGPGSYIVAYADDHIFITQDNGLLPFTLTTPVSRAHRLERYTRPLPVANIAQIIGNGIATATMPNNSLPDIAGELMEAPRLLQAKTSKGRIDCNVLAINRYGNLILNLTKREFNELVGDLPFSLLLPGKRKLPTKSLNAITQHFFDVPEGELLCRFNQNGFLEIAMNKASAADEFLSEATSSRLDCQYFSICFG
jgi:S-adenosyl-L-methionine hydrolase (adenosine-forming)